MLFFLAGFFLFDSLQTVIKGILIGKGRYGLSVIWSAIIYYLVAVPVEIVLAFPLGMDIYGIWTGMIVGALLVSIALGILAVRTPWVAISHSKES